MAYVTFRVDASTAMGIGHVMRCLTLAEALQASGYQSLFVCRTHPGHLCELIAERGFTVVRLPVNPTLPLAEEGAPRHAAWLGDSWASDAEQTRQAIADFGGTPAWIVIDHYAIERRWQGMLRSLTERILVIDDLADRPHDCDLLLDQNLVPQMQQRYEGKLPERAVALLGPEYALLQPIYRELRKQVQPRVGPIRRLVVFFGGADNGNLTGRVIDAFLGLNRPDVTVDVVITPAMQHAESVRRQIEGRDNIHLHTGLPTLAHLIFQSDLAIGAGGATSWERLCLGLPALVITLADNQRPLAEGLQQAGLIRWLGHDDETTVADIADALGELLRVGLDESWSRNCLGAVDGQGLQRVCTAMLIDVNAPLHVRPAGAADERQLLVWANDPVVRRNAFSTDPISAETHHRWFHGRLANSSSRLFIVESSDGVALGQVRFDLDEGNWRIDYSLAPMLRGRGLGRRLLEAALSTLASECAGHTVVGEVKMVNLPSRRVFESLGFRIHSHDNNVVEYRREL
jgi:UDP-2,4-diacetamido-2,4,6-trideoxy-beta-L-altropyranose hydrolase